MAVTEVDPDLLDEAARTQDIVNQLTPALEFASRTEKHAAMFSSTAIKLLTSPAIAQQQAMLGTITKSFKFQDDVVKGMFGGLPSETLGIFTSLANDLSKSLDGDLFKGSAVGFSYFKNPIVGLSQDSFKHLPIGFSEGFFEDSAVGVAHDVFSEDMKRLIEPITASIASITTAGLTDWMFEVRPARWLGLGVREDTNTVDRSVDTWLYQLRPDLRRKYRSMRDALESSLDPVLHATTSAVELLLHLCGVCGVSDGDVRAWAKSDAQFATEAIDTSQGFARVTWAGRARLAAIRGGFDEVGQALVVSLAESAPALQRMKHSAHHYGISDVEPHLVCVDELLSMLAWRL